MDGFTCRGAWRGSAGGKRARAGAVTEYTPHAASIEHKATPLPHRGAAPAPTHNLRPCSCDRRDWCGGTAAEPRLESAVPRTARSLKEISNCKIRALP